jgi:hypothetical protein
MGDRTSRTSPDKRHLSVRHPNGQTGHPPIGCPLSGVWSGISVLTSQSKRTTRDERRKRNDQRDPLPPPKPFDAYFGVCPRCKRNDGLLNVGHSHWFVCHEHRVTWCIGSNLFSGWRDHDEATFQKERSPAENLSRHQTESRRLTQYLSAQPSRALAQTNEPVSSVRVLPGPAYSGGRRSRNIARCQSFWVRVRPWRKSTFSDGCFCGQADINRHARPAASVENDPTPTPIVHRSIATIIERGRSQCWSREALAEHPYEDLGAHVHRCAGHIHIAVLRL